MEHDDAARGRLPLWLVVVVLAAAVSPLAASLMRSATGGWFAVLVVTQILATAVAAGVPLWRQRAAARSEATAEERELEARVETRVALNDALDPILRLLGAIALEEEVTLRDQRRAQAVPLVLLTAAEFIGPDRARACWFRLDAGPPTSLVPDSAAGRAGSPTTTFVAGTPSGDAAIGLVLADEDLLCEDIEADPPPGWDLDKERDYRSFISVSVIAGDTAYGMLTLDAVEPSTLDVEDMALLRLMAGVLAVALSIP